MTLKIVKAGSRKAGKMIGITGQYGVGKTTLAATFPKPIVFDFEGGSDVLARFGTDVVHEWAWPKGGRLNEVLAATREVAKSDYETLVIDSWTYLSDMIEKDVLDDDPAAESLATVGKGFGDGYLRHAARTKELLAAMRWMQEAKKKNIVWIMHLKISSTNLPTGENFSRFNNEGVGKSLLAIGMACDAIAMLRQSIEVVDQTSKTPGKVLGTGSRELVLGSAPYVDIKSRFDGDEETRTIPVELGVFPFQYALDQD